MPKSPADDELLDWTITEEPFKDPELPPPEPMESPAGEHSSAPARPSINWDRLRAISLRAWLVGALAVGLALLSGSWLFTAWRQGVRREAVLRVMAQEDAAVLRSDVEAVQALTAPDDSGWLAQRRAEALAQQVAPLPIPFAWPAGEPGRAITVEQLAPDLIKVDVQYDFVTSQGRAATFITPRFYREREGWARSAPPEAFWDTPVTRFGRRLHWTFFPADRAFVESIHGDVEATLDRACAEWACPAELHLTLRLDNRAPYVALGEATGSWLMSLALNEPDGLEATDIYVPSFQSAGYPANAASAELLKRIIALRVLARAAAHVSGESNSGATGSFFRYALAARLAARLGLERPEITNVLAPPPSVPQEALWALAPWSTRASDRDARDALVVLNQLLRDQPPEVEAALMRGLTSARSLRGWLAKGLGLTEGQVRLRLDRIWNQPFPVHVLAPDSAMLGLNCAEGPVWISTNGGQVQLTPMLSSYIPDVWRADWSPDGQRMLFNIAGQLAVADFTTGGLTWLPTQEGAQGYTSAGWTSSTVVAYGQYRPGTWQSLLFFDVLDPQRRPVGLEGVAHSLISPDRSKIAFTTDFGSLRWTNLREGLVAAPRSAQATPIQTVDENVSQLLTWSPDGRFILYSRFGDLRMVDVTTGAVRALPDAPALHNATFDSLLAHWSPDGQWLVFLQNTYSSVGQRRGQALRMKPDGSEGLILTEGRSNLWLSGFLAGGQIVAVMRIDRARLPTATLLIDLAAGKTIRTLPGEFMASDADGKALVFAQKDGVYLLRDVTDPGRPPEKLLDRACRYGWWNLTSPGP